MIECFALQADTAALAGHPVAGKDCATDGGHERVRFACVFAQFAGHI